MLTIDDVAGWVTEEFGDGWWHKIDTDNLTQDSSPHCVIGQLGGSWIKFDRRCQKEMGGAFFCSSTYDDIWISWIERKVREDNGPSDDELYRNNPHVHADAIGPGFPFRTNYED
jgi:hypothetical protein